MTEQWRAIPGFGGRYFISNRGRVKTTAIYKGPSAGWIEDEQILRPTDNGHGYKIICLHDGGRRENRYIHRLVAEAFLERQAGKNIVDHIDHNTENNVAANLRWCTQKENIAFSAMNMAGKLHNLKTNTGERYITRSKNGRYRVTFQRKDYGTFYSIDEAIAKRNAILAEKGVIL